MFMLLFSFKRSFFSAQKCALPEQLEYVFVLWSFVCGIFFYKLLLKDDYSFDKLLSCLLIKIWGVKLQSCKLFLLIMFLFCKFSCLSLFYGGFDRHSPVCTILTAGHKEIIINKKLKWSHC